MSKPEPDLISERVRRELGTSLKGAWNYQETSPDRGQIEPETSLKPSLFYSQAQKDLTSALNEPKASSEWVRIEPVTRWKRAHSKPEAISILLLTIKPGMSSECARSELGVSPDWAHKKTGTSPKWARGHHYFLGSYGSYSSNWTFPESDEKPFALSLFHKVDPWLLDNIKGSKKTWQKLFVHANMSIFIRQLSSNRQIQLYCIV